jgi:RNA polymerase sigma-70 factor (ECF subfamily)
MGSNQEFQIAAFSDLTAASRSRVFGYIYAMLHNMSDAEDVYQQTTVLLWEKFGEFEQGTDFAAWALKVAYYNIKNFQRSQGRSRVFFSEAVMEKVADSYQAGDAGSNDDRTDALIACLKQLPEKHRSLLELRYAENVSVKHLAELEDRSEAAVGMKLSRLRKLLLRCIQLQLAGTE